jgi:hypothetical protein
MWAKWWLGFISCHASLPPFLKFLPVNSISKLAQLAIYFKMIHYLIIIVEGYGLKEQVGV